MKDHRIEPRMYREPRQTMGEKKQKDGFTVKSKTSTIIYGVDTNVVTRKQMFDMLPEIVDTEYDKFVSPNVYSDLASLEKKKNGKIEHSASGHDDSLMAYLIFRFAVFHGRCFKDRFGINPVPSRMNVKVVSSAGDFSKIEKILATAVSAENMTNMSDAYLKLAEQESKLKTTEENKQLNAFLRVTNWNREE